MNEKWRFRQLDLSVSSQSYMNKQDTVKKGQRPLDLTVPSMQTMLRLSFYQEEELIEGSTFIATEFARFGLTIHLCTKEPDRVT
jgi:hypothetical protein